MPKKKNLVGQVFGKLTVIRETDKRIDGKVVWECQCECGKIAYVPTSRLTSGNTRSCGCLAHHSPKINIGDKFNLLTVIATIDDKPKYYKCQCECGNFTEVYEYNLKNNQVKSCGCLRRKPSEHRLDLTGQKFGMLTAIAFNEEKSSSNRTYWTCQCECGNYTDMLLSNLTKPDRFPSCGCITSRSVGEQKIEKLLQQNEISFIKEQSFETCRNPITNRLLFFDFYVNNEYLIEFDGEQHFQETKGVWNSAETLQDRQFRDKVKNEWCKQYNIPLIRIPYTCLSKLTLEDLQLETSQFLIK